MNELDLTIYPALQSTQSPIIWYWVIAILLLIIGFSAFITWRFYWLRTDRSAIRSLRALHAHLVRADAIPPLTMDKVFVFFKQWLAFRLTRPEVMSMTDSELVHYIERIPDPALKQAVSIISDLSTLRFSSLSIDKNEFSGKLSRLIELITSATK